MRPIAVYALVCACFLVQGCARTDPAANLPDESSAHGLAIASNPRIQRAIDRVYPALVQIWVLDIYDAGGRERKSQAAGSGVIISASGLVVTNYHVAGRTADIRCVMSNREELPATLVGADPLSDLAILQLDLSARRDHSPLPVATFGSSAHLQVGDPVLAMGCPHAISQSVTMGIIANIGMTLPRLGNRHFEIQGEDVGSIVKWIGHDAAIFPGNSGGPLVDLDGRIIGINEISNGLGGSIPSDLAKSVCDQLIAHGTVNRIWIGALFQALLKDDVRKGHDQGVLVSGVLQDSPAQGRLQAGDIVLAVNGTPVRARFPEELPNFQNFILTQPLGHPLRFSILRGTGHLEVTVSPLARDEMRAKEVESKPWGMTLRRMTTVESKQLRRHDTTGVLVGSLRPGGPADSAIPNLQEDDVILEVAGKPTSTLAEFFAVTQGATADTTQPVPVTVRFERQNEQLLTVVEIGTTAPEIPPTSARHGWLPVATQVLSPQLATALGLTGHMGVRITQIFPGDVATRAGFKVGDVITKVDDQLVEASTPQDSQLFESMVRAYKPNAVVSFTIYRDRAMQILTVALSSSPKKDNELRSYEDSVLEFKVRDISYADRIANRWNDDQHGALVTEVESGGWALVGGLQKDDVIMAVNGSAVTSTDDLFAHLLPIEKSHSTHLTLFILRGITTSFIELQPAWPANPAIP